MQLLTNLIILSMLSNSIPNLSVFFPVEILLKVSPSISGLSLTPISTILFFSFAKLSRSFISSKDSVLIKRIFLCIA